MTYLAPFQSLQLLKDAIFDNECAYLFSLEVYGHIIGMFELNNLDLVVASPDRDGQAVIIACRPISVGEEITISYIDEDLPYEERQAQLADYGFKCRCSKCLEEKP
ncbi:hypothetical protein J5N97_016757 [Dioscorea zingiberensis]|uniref:SET domain-containing protein n=1 Tax=Dioscorea zingiberensis TaxID=325984 RepID=A0A9D5HFY9_9LILI|nr:hypothetical protein J5N97_016757 [Dioscorea zingiberensis]